MTMTRIERVGPGSYRVIKGHRSVTVIRNPELHGPWKWIAYAEWDKYLVTDPVATKLEAVNAAKFMLEEPHKNPANRRNVEAMKRAAYGKAKRKVHKAVSKTAKRRYIVEFEKTPGVWEMFVIVEMDRSGDARYLRKLARRESLIAAKMTGKRVRVTN